MEIEWNQFSLTTIYKNESYLGGVKSDVPVSRVTRLELERLSRKE
jgi:hypothetical protein